VEGKAVLVCEGAFDCLSLWTAGISAVATGGAALYDLQRIVMAQLGMQPIWAFDRDKAGRKATLDAAKLYGKPSAFIFAPNDASGSEKGHDWNSFLITEGSAMVRQYVMDNIAPLDEKFTFALMRSLTA
jgi:DNA primase